MDWGGREHEKVLKNLGGVAPKAPGKPLGQKVGGQKRRRKGEILAHGGSQKHQKEGKKNFWGGGKSLLI